jgi:hypothetical protein
MYGVSSSGGIERSLRAVAAATETARAPLMRAQVTSVPIMSRLAVASQHLDSVRAAVLPDEAREGRDGGRDGGGLRYVAVAPLFVPDQWRDVPAFLSTAKEVGMLDADRAAERLGMDLGARSDITQYNDACSAALAAFERAAAAPAAAGTAAASAATVSSSSSSSEFSSIAGAASSASTAQSMR